MITEDLEGKQDWRVTAMMCNERNSRLKCRVVECVRINIMNQSHHTQSKVPIKHNKKNVWMKLKVRYDRQSEGNRDATVENGEFKQARIKCLGRKRLMVSSCGHSLGRYKASERQTDTWNPDARYFTHFSNKLKSFSGAVHIIISKS